MFFSAKGIVENEIYDNARRYFKAVCFIPRFISETYLSLSRSESNKLQLQSRHIRL
jgi:hypothetical protein